MWPPPKPVYFLLAFGIAGVAAFTLVHDLADSKFAPLFESISSALLAAGFIGWFIDGPTKRVIAQSFGSTVFWGLASDEAPKEHKEALMSLASRKIFIRRSEINLTVYPDRDEDDLIRIRIRVSGSGEYWEDEVGVWPNGKGRILASSKGKQSRWIATQVKVSAGEHSGKYVLRLDEDQLRTGNGIVKKSHDGGVILNFDKALKNLEQEAELSRGTHFSYERDAEVFRHMRGFFPFWTSHTACGSTLYVDKTRVPGLRFHATVLGEGSSRSGESLKEETDGNQDKLKFDVGSRVAGGTLILSWSPPPTTE